MPVNSKRKGNAGELELAKILTKHFGKPFARVGVSSGARVKNTNLPDTAIETFTGDLVTPERFRFSVEVKNVKASGSWWWFGKNALLEKFFAQAESDANSVGKKPLLCLKVPQRGWLAAVLTKDMPFIPVEAAADWDGHFCIYQKWVIYPLEFLLKHTGCTGYWFADPLGNWDDTPF